ncbi:hypothetical protein vBVpaMR16F_210 [Vibrio phage vB_VpaM_R16F]|nr:hypothetical protein vBVpaMR16F_210 [Vibrio phage vB_VpaM_R16F]
MNTDMRGIEVSVGDIIVYGKSDRNNPINIGKIMSIDGDYMKVLGKGNTKAGEINIKWKRFIVVPKDYWEK